MPRHGVGIVCCSIKGRYKSGITIARFRVIGVIVVEFAFYVLHIWRSTGAKVDAALLPMGHSCNKTSCEPVQTIYATVNDSSFSDP